MRLKVFKIYNRATHSYMAVLKTVATDTEDPAIFVCIDRSIQGDCPVESSSSGSSESSSAPEIFESSSSEGSSF